MNNRRNQRVYCSSVFQSDMRCHGYTLHSLCIRRCIENEYLFNENRNMHKCSPNNNLSSIQPQGYLFPLYIHRYFIYISKRLGPLETHSINGIHSFYCGWKWYRKFHKYNSNSYEYVWIKYKAHKRRHNIILFSSKTPLNMKIYGHNDKVDFDSDKQMWTRWIEVKIPKKCS